MHLGRARGHPLPGTHPDSGPRRASGVSINCAPDFPRKPRTLILSWKHITVGQKGNVKKRAYTHDKGTWVDVTTKYPGLPRTQVWMTKGPHTNPDQLRGGQRVGPGNSAPMPPRDGLNTRVPHSERACPRPAASLTKAGLYPKVSLALAFLHLR